MDEDIIQGQTANAASLYSHPLVKSYLSKVYAWMALSLVISAGVAIYSTHNDSLMQWTLQHPILIMLSTLGLIIIMGLCRNILTAGALGVLLMVFAGAWGMLLGPLLMIYTQESLGTTFACAAGTFGAMSMYGLMTKRDLGPMGRALTMVLIGLVICLVVNFFWGNGTFDLIISAVGVILFSLLTAYDTQKLIREGLVLRGEGRAKGSILGALDLYLDFMNLFLYLLRFLGDRR